MDSNTQQNHICEFIEFILSFLCKMGYPSRIFATIEAEGDNLFPSEERLEELMELLAPELRANFYDYDVNECGGFNVEWGGYWTFLPKLEEFAEAHNLTFSVTVYPEDDPSFSVYVGQMRWRLPSVASTKEYHRSDVIGDNFISVKNFVDYMGFDEASQETIRVAREKFKNVIRKESQRMERKELLRKQSAAGVIKSRALEALYRPGGPVYQQAEQHFYNLANQTK